MDPSAALSGGRLQQLLIAQLGIFVEILPDSLDQQMLPLGITTAGFVNQLGNGPGTPQALALPGFPNQFVH